MIGNIGRLQACRTDHLMERIGLFRGQAILLMILSEEDGLTHSELAAKLRISPAAATKVIKRLEKLHYLERKSEPSDERVSRVFLREEGWAIIQEIKNIFRSIHMIMFKDISAEDQVVLANHLGRVYSNLKESIDQQI